MKQSLVATGSLNRLLQEAGAAWECGDFPKCIETLQRAHRLAPSNTSILLQLGRMLGLRHDYAAAESCFEQALRIAPRKTGMLVAVADHCQNFRKPEFVEPYLRRAVEQPDATPEACIKLAEVCERLRRLPEAAQLVKRALTLNPAYPPAQTLRARLDRMAGRLEAAEQGLRSFLARPHVADWTHALAWYELATILDRQGKYDEAMSEFNQAKAMLQPQASTYLAHGKTFRARLKVMEANVSSELFQRWTAAAPTVAPLQRLAMLCGYPRSGTTLLEQVLDAHPDIVSAEETNTFLDEAFFPLKRRLHPDALMLPVLEAADTQALRQARTDYFRGMELSLGTPVAGRLLVDKNPDNTHMIPAYLRIFPEIKFLVAMRDPRDVVLSCFMQAQALNQSTAADLTLGGAAERYADIMSLWRTQAPLLTGRYIEIRYEDMVDDLASVARRTLEFLGVPWDDRVLGFDRHAREKVVRSHTYADVTQPVYKRARGRWRNYQKYLEPHLEKLEPFVKAFGYE